MENEALEALKYSFYQYRNTDIYPEDVEDIKLLKEILKTYLEYVKETEHHICEDILDLEGF